MGIFDHFASTDWDGDGRITDSDDAMEIMMVQQLVENDERERRIETVVRAITQDGISKTIHNDGFEDICRLNGLDVDDFTQEDIYEIQRRLDRY